MNLAETINNVLGSLLSRSPEIQVCVLANSDGLLIGYRATGEFQGLDAPRAAQLAGIFRDARANTASTARIGECRRFMIQGSEGSLFALQIQADLLLTVRTAESARAGLVFSDLSRAASELSGILNRVIV